MYSHAFVGPLIKPGVDGLLLVMVIVLALAEVPQSFNAYTLNTLVL
jgi:hypothetical protein